MTQFPDVVATEFPDTAEPKLADFKSGSVAWVIQRFKEKMGRSRTKALGDSHRCTLGVIQRMPIGKRPASKYTKHDVQEMAEELIARDLSPATVNQYVNYLTGALKYAKSAFRDCDDIDLVPIEDAKPFLKKNGLLGKSRPRDRRPSPDEIKQVEAYCKEHDADPRCDIQKGQIFEFQIWSCRRLGETCRIKCIDVNREKRTVVVRDMKDPKHKKGNDVEVPLLGRAWEIVVERMKDWDGHNPNTRLFPYNVHSVSAAFHIAYKRLEIKGLRTHDLRREGASRLFEAGFSVQEVMLVTGHKTPQMLLRVYTKLKPEDLHKGPAAMRGLAPNKTFVGDTRELASVAPELLRNWDRSFHRNPVCRSRKVIREEAAKKLARQLLDRRIEWYAVSDPIIDMAAKIIMVAVDADEVAQHSERVRQQIESRD